MYKSEHIITSKHYLALLCISFVTGVFLALLFRPISALLTGVVIFIILETVLFLIKSFVTIKPVKKIFLVSVVIFLFYLLGIFRVCVANDSIKHHIQKYSDKEVWVYGTVVSEPHLTSSKYYHTFELDAFKINDEDISTKTMVVYYPQARECNIHPGDNIFFWAKLDPHSSTMKSSGYDYYIDMLKRNIFLSAYPQNINILEETKQTSVLSEIKYLGSLIRTEVSQGVDFLFEDDHISAAILKGILIGDKSGFDDDLYTQFSNSGISHIVAVSGLHISILVAFMMLLFRFTKLKLKLIRILTIPVIIIFMAVSSFTPSVCRAAIMIFIMSASILTNEQYDPITSLFVALGIIVFIAPFSLLSKGLILSFSAVLGIFVYFPYINKYALMPLAPVLRRIPAKRRRLKNIISFIPYSLSLSISTFIGTAFFVVLFFDKVSYIQLLTNLWIVPVVNLIFCLGYFACILMYISPYLLVNMIKPILAWCLGIIKATISVFGNNCFSYTPPIKNLTLAHAIIYFGAAYMVYMTLKTISDIREEQAIISRQNQKNEAENNILEIYQ